MKHGHAYKFSIRQYSGVTRKVVGAFQITVPVKTDPEILPTELRKLSVMRYIQQSIPVGNRWHSIFVRYLDQIAARVRGFGGDPDAVKPSPDGGEGRHVSLHPKPVDVCPPDLWCLNIPWNECEFEGEINVKIRFRRKC